MFVNLSNDAGIIKTCKIGFSWTTFFFGFFPALFRGDLKWGAIIFIISLIVGSFTFGIGTLFVDVAFAFIYNKLYIKELLEKGYRPSDDQARKALIENDIISGNTTGQGLNV